MKIYNSIHDLPVLIWDKIHKTNDVSLLYSGICSKYVTKLINKGIFVKYFIRKWESIYNEFFEEFDQGEELKEILELKKQLIKLKLEFVKSKDRYLLNEIKIIEIQLEKSQQSKESKIGEILYVIEKNMGFAIDNPSVYKFYNYINRLKKENNGKKGKA